MDLTFLKWVSDLCPVGPSTRPHGRRKQVKTSENVPAGVYTGWHRMLSEQQKASEWGGWGGYLLQECV